MCPLRRAGPCPLPDMPHRHAQALTHFRTCPIATRNSLVGFAQDDPISRSHHKLRLDQNVSNLEVAGFKAVAGLAVRLFVFAFVGAPAVARAEGLEFFRRALGGPDSFGNHETGKIEAIDIGVQLRIEPELIDFYAGEREAKIGGFAQVAVKLMTEVRGEHELFL